MKQDQVVEFEGGANDLFKVRVMLEGNAQRDPKWENCVHSTKEQDGSACYSLQVANEGLGVLDDVVIKLEDLSERHSHGYVDRDHPDDSVVLAVLDRFAPGALFKRKFKIAFGEPNRSAEARVRQHRLVVAARMDGRTTILLDKTVRFIAGRGE